MLQEGRPTRSARTGYVRNGLAGGLASTRSRLVAAVVPTIAGPVFLQTVQALTEALAERGYQLMLGQSGYADSREDALLEAIIGRRPDGIVLTGIMHSAEGPQAPAGRRHPGGRDLGPDAHAARHAGRLLARRRRARGGRASCTRKGRRRLAVVAGDDERSQPAPRRPSRTRRAPPACPRCRLIVRAGADHAEERPQRAGRTAARRAPDIDAVFCSSDLLALGVMTEAQARGIAVPEQLAVVGFGDLEFAADLHPALTTVRIDGTAIGRQAARFIVDRAEGPRRSPQRVVDIGFSIVERDSA